MADRGGKIFNRDIRLSKGAKLIQGENTVSHYVVYGGTKTTAGGSASESITITGILTTDIPFVTIKDNGTNNVTILQASITASNTLTITFSGDPSSDTIIYYSIMRATA